MPATDRERRSDGVLAATALQLRDRLASGALKAVDVAAACLEAIAAREPEVGAWAFLDEGCVLRQAEALDSRREKGRPIGPLHGLPVGLKDIIDTEDMPTENGTPIDAGRQPTRDATVARRCVDAGALIMGKTVSTELGSMRPRGTRNPFDADAHARRLVQRVGCGSRRRNGAARRRHADRRVGDPSRLLLRRGRVQAHVRSGPAPRRPSAGDAARYGRRLRAHRGGRRSHRRRARRVQFGRSRLAASAAAAAARHRALRTAAGAGARFRENPVLGCGRHRDP